MMRLVRFLSSVFAFLFFTAFLFSFPTAAQSVDTKLKVASGMFDPSAKPKDINQVPILANIVKGGAKLYYLGQRSGLDGWLIVKNGQIQMIYVSSDGETTLIGALFTKEGDNVTSPQIDHLLDSNKELKELLTGSAKQQVDVLDAGSKDGVAAVQGDPSVAKNASDGGLPSVILSPGERLIRDLQAAAGITAGKNQNAEILMVVDPDCPHCKKTWLEIRDYVQKNQVQVKIVPISGNLKEENTKKAAKILSFSDPFNGWDQYVKGDKSMLAGEPEGAHVKAVLSNRVLVDRWNITTTPYLVYRSKDGRVKIVQGKPERMAAIISDLLR